MRLLLTLAMLFLAVLPVRAAPLSIVALGDSLTAGYGLAAGEDFATRLEAALVASGIDASVANAGVSGDTASAGAARVDWAVPDGAALVIVELGANDALRGIDPAVTRKALSDLLARLGARNLRALLVGMRAPPNMGEDYVRSFDAIYPDLAREHAVPLYPFFLDGVAGAANLNQPDGMHPTAAGVEEIVRRILPVVIAALGKSTH
ncbi:MAG TPA: arylesterase [Aestuariivirgaceae bacterium]|nr:arylesterase [Aestuariivirgaceae bacterium]